LYLWESEQSSWASGAGDSEEVKLFCLKGTYIGKQNRLKQKATRKRWLNEVRNKCVWIVHLKSCRTSLMLKGAYDVIFLLNRDRVSECKHFVFIKSGLCKSPVVQEQIFMSNIDMSSLYLFVEGFFLYIYPRGTFLLL